MLPHAATSGPRPVKLRRFAAPVLLRPGSADVAVVRNLLLTEPHLPPDGAVPADARLVWDLGAHIGVAAMDYATRYPQARVVAVELMAENAKLCRRNLAAFGDRCEVVEAGVWDEDGTVEIVAPDAADVDTNSFQAADANGSGPTERRPAIALDTLLAREPADARVALMKLDVEGAETRILTSNTGWAARVDALLVEVHGDYTRERCTADLQRLGFTRVEPGREDNLLLATRR
jgi:FkbM family methyltransferase